MWNWGKVPKKKLIFSHFSGYKPTFFIQYCCNFHTNLKIELSLSKESGAFLMQFHQRYPFSKCQIPVALLLCELWLMDAVWASSTCSVGHESTYAILTREMKISKYFTSLLTTSFYLQQIQIVYRFHHKQIHWWIHYNNMVILLQGKWI